MIEYVGGNPYQIIFLLSCQVLIDIQRDIAIALDKQKETSFALVPRIIFGCYDFPFVVQDVLVSESCILIE